MSKRGQKTASNEGSPTAKAKPCLVLREQRCEEISSRSLGSLVNLGNADERKEVVQASRQLVQEDPNQTESDETIFQLHKLKEACCVITKNCKTWNTRAVNTWARSFSIC